MPNDRCFAHLSIPHKQDLQGTLAVVNHLRVDQLTHLRHYRTLQGKSEPGKDLGAIWAEPSLHLASLRVDKLQSSGILLARLLKTGMNRSVCPVRVSQANKRPLINAEKGCHRGSEERYLELVANSVISARGAYSCVCVIIENMAVV